MCGRFVSARKRAELLEEFAVQRDAVASITTASPRNTVWRTAPVKVRPA